jgi:hypothetical protein
VNARNLIFAFSILAGLSGPVVAEQATSQNVGLKTFIETCVLGAPEFKNGEAKFRRLGLPVLDFEATKLLRISADSPTVWAVWGRMKNLPDGKVCGILVRGGDTRPIVPTVKKYADSPDFPYKGRRAGLRFLGTGITPELSREYQLPDGRLLILVVTTDYTYVGRVGELTMMLAMIGTPAKR